MTTPLRALILNNWPLIRLNVCFCGSNCENQELPLCGVRRILSDPKVHGISGLSET